MIRSFSFGFLLGIGSFFYLIDLYIQVTGEPFLGWDGDPIENDNISGYEKLYRV